jgi:hypothetical protein
LLEKAFSDSKRVAESMYSQKRSIVNALRSDVQEINDNLERGHTWLLKYIQQQQQQQPQQQPSASGSDADKSSSEATMAVWYSNLIERSQQQQDEPADVVQPRLNCDELDDTAALQKTLAGLFHITDPVVNLCQCALSWQSLSSTRLFISFFLTHHVVRHSLCPGCTQDGR